MKRLLPLLMISSLSLSGMVVDKDGHSHHVRPHHFYKDSRFYWGAGTGAVATVGGILAALFVFIKVLTKKEEKEKR